MLSSPSWLAASVLDGADVTGAHKEVILYRQKSLQVSCDPVIEKDTFGRVSPLLESRSALRSPQDGVPPA